MSKYDDWIHKQVQKQMERDYCTPKIIDVEREFEGYDSDGVMETSLNYIYNCDECDNMECPERKK